MLDSDFRRLQVEVVSISESGVKLSGLLYRPCHDLKRRFSPAVVLAHGIGGSKEMMSGIGLELAKHGFVALCIDLIGHGGSDGRVGEGVNDPSFGVLSALRYLKSKPYVNASAIGLVGHSLGGGAIRAAFASDPEIKAAVLIAGGLGRIAEGPYFGVLNTTFPKNLLVIIGKYDVLFNLTNIEAEELPPVFGTDQRVTPGVVYGNFSTQNARKLVTPSTTHLFEPLDPTVVSEIVEWMKNSFKFQFEETNFNQTYIQREAAVVGSLISFFGIVLTAFPYITQAVGLEKKTNSAEIEHATLPGWKLFGVWGILELILLLPMFFMGLTLLFPPLVFGASIAWWTLSVGLTGLTVLVIILGKPHKGMQRLKIALLKTFNGKCILAALALFIFTIAVVSFIEMLLKINMRIVTPLFRAPVSTRRLTAFFEFTPFFLVYFLVEGLYLHEFKNYDKEGRRRNFPFNLLSCVEVVLGKIAPFIAMIGLNYVPAVFFHIWLLPSYVGFIVEFLWLIVPIFIITTTISWCIHRKTGNIWAGAFFNTLIMSWSASNVFPF